MQEKTTPITGAVAVITYLKRTFDPICGLEDTVANSPFFPLARAMMLEQMFARLPRIEKLADQTAKVEMGEA